MAAPTRRASPSKGLPSSFLQCRPCETHPAAVQKACTRRVHWSVWLGVFKRGYNKASGNSERDLYAMHQFGFNCARLLIDYTRYPKRRGQSTFLSGRRVLERLSRRNDRAAILTFRFKELRLGGSDGGPE